MRKWCETCFDDTEHFVKVLPGRVACKACRAREKPLHVSRADQKVITVELRKKASEVSRAARLTRQEAKLKQHAEVLAKRQAERLAARFAPRWCFRCAAVTERELHGRGVRCIPCGQKRASERDERRAKLRAAATPKNIKRQHIANPHLPCPGGHHDWSPGGVCRACTRLRHRWSMTDPEKAAHAMWKRAKGRAALKGLPFDIEPTDCAVPAECPVFGAFVQDSGDRFGMVASLDRIEPSKGYVKGNTIVISSLANSIKNMWTREQLRAVANCDALWPA